MLTIHKKTKAPSKPHPDDIYEITDYDDNAKFLIGWPGYRTSQNKSGLGYVESRAELAHMQGKMIRWLITGKFITHNPIYLLIMFAFGTFIGVIPLGFLLVEIFISHDFRVVPYIMPFISPYVVVGILLVINAGISIFNPRARSITGD